MAGPGPPWPDLSDPVVPDRGAPWRRDAFVDQPGVQFTADGIVAALVSQCPQFFEQADQRRVSRRLKVPLAMLRRENRLGQRNQDRGSKSNTSKRGKSPGVA